jgi:hypothetical protein
MILIVSGCYVVNVACIIFYASHTYVHGGAVSQSFDRSQYVLKPKNSIELFHQHYSNAESTVTPDDTAALPQLLADLQYLPLAIVQVAAYVDLNRLIAISKYLEMFKGTKESQKRLLSNPHGNIWRDNNENAETILTTFSISFRQLQQQSKLADSFLRFMACIDRKAIP